MNLDPLAILDALPEAALLRDAEGVVRHVNPAAERLLKIRAADVVGGRELPYVSVEQLAEGNRFYIYLDYRRHFEVKIIPCGSDGLESSASLVVYRDMTAIQDFYLAVYSNLVGLLTPIRGFTQLLALGAGGPLSDKQNELASTAFNSSRKMRSYIEILLYWAELAKFRDIHLKDETINLKEFIDDRFSYVKKRQLLCDTEDTSIVGDKDKLGFVFGCLGFLALYEDTNILSTTIIVLAGLVTIEIKIERYV